VDLAQGVREKQKVREIAPGAVVMLAGVVLLSLAG